MPSDDEYGAFHAEFEAVSGDVLNVPAARDMFRHGWKAGRAFESHRLAASLAREARLREALAVYSDESNWNTTNLYEFPDVWIRPGENGCDIAQAALAAAPAAGGQPRDGEEAGMSRGAQPPSAGEYPE